MNLIKSLLIFLLLLAIISCGGCGESTTVKTISVNCVDNISSDTEVDPNSIKLQLLSRTGLYPYKNTPLENVVVQLDYDGICVKSNAQGFVTFPAVSNGSHDVHSFPEGDYGWKSIYDVKAGVITRLYFYLNMDEKLQTPTSYVSLKGLIKNRRLRTRFDIEFYPTSIDSYTLLPVSVDYTENNYSVDIELPVPPGTTITGDLLMHEHQHDSTTGENFLSDTRVYLKQTYVTSEAKSDFKTFNVDMSLQKPTVSEILTYKNINTPNGVSLQSLGISTDANFYNGTIENPFLLLYNKDNQNISLDFSAPYKVSFYEPFNLPTVNVFLVSSSKKTNTRSYLLRKYPKNTTDIIVNYVINEMPILEDNQSGELITWNKIYSDLSFQSISLYSEDQKVYWSFYLNPRATQLRIPNIPAGIAPMLTSGLNYSLTYSGGVDLVDGFETYSISTGLWTR